jgi:arylsulfatase A-like enzyme/Tfp pilus assembly protein PilF
VAIIAVAAAALLAVRWRAPARPTVPPDVLLVTVDTLRADHVGAYGYRDAATPVIDSLASRGARFAQAIAATPLTLPSHASIFTASTPPRHGVRDNVGFVMGTTMPMMAERFRAAGYGTAGFISGFPLHRRFGLARGFEHYDDRLTRGGDRARPAPVERRADETVAAVDTWLGQAANQPQRPLFLWVHLFDPHAPYDAPEPYRTKFSGRPYDGEVAFTDAQIGALLERLQRRRPDRRTVIAVTADHGEGLGEHGEPTHGLLVYDSTIRVPLVVVGPGVPAARVVNSMVRLIDVAPTLLDLSGVAALDGAEGVSLRTVLMRDRAGAGPAAQIESLFGWLCCGWAPLHAWRDEAWKFIDAPRAELYDTSTDSGELRNLAPSRTADASRFRRELEAALTRLPAPAHSQSPSDARDRLRSLGYVTGGGTTTPSRRDPKDVADLSVQIGQAIEIEYADPATAAAMLSHVLRADPGNPLARRHLGIALIHQRRHADAVRVLNALVADGDNSAETLSLLADAAIAQGDLRAARSRLETLYTRDPADSGVALKLGILLVRAHELERAAAVFRAIVDREPDNADALVDLAGALLSSGAAADAAKYFQKAIDLGAAGTLAWNGLAFAKLQSGDRNGAAEAMRQSLRIQPDQPDIIVALKNLGLR